MATLTNSDNNIVVVVVANNKEKENQVPKGKKKLQPQQSKTDKPTKWTIKRDNKSLSKNNHIKGTTNYQLDRSASQVDDGCDVETSSHSDSSSEEAFEDASEKISNSSISGDSGLSSRMTSSPAASLSAHSSDDENQTSTADQSDDDEECPSLEDSLRDITRLLAMALDNRFHEAYRGTEKWSHCSLYHALGKGTLSFLKGCLTLERPEIQLAIEDLRNCVEVCQRAKRQSMTRMVWRPNYNTYTDVEIHAELCYAEALLMTALLTFLEDQSILNLVRGAFRIRACYQSYKECFYILNNRTEWISDFSRLHFESGVRMGIGTFNLILSHMPSKVLKLLEFVGFSGNRRQGIIELEASTSLAEGLRCPLAILIMLAYQCYIEHIFGLGDGDMNCVTRLVDFALNRHPDGAFFLLFLGRQKQLTGHIEEAIEAFERCIASQNEWKQFHNICYWELLWCYAVQCDWVKASNCADILRKQCKWSPGAYTYQYATFLYMIMTEENKPEMGPEITRLLKLVPELRIRYAGKTIPAEKFAIIQSEKYFAQDEKLLLPALEFMYIWNIFAVIGRSPHLLNPIMERIEKCLKIEEQNLDCGEALDDYCRCLLLKGMCLRYLQKTKESNKCFLEVIENKSEIMHDTYLIPHATLELGLNYMSAKQYPEAKQWLEQARTQHSGYALETIVHFRVHTAMRTMSTNKHSEQNEPLAANGDDDEENVENDSDAKKNGGGIRSIWSEFSRRLIGDSSKSTKTDKDAKDNDEDEEDNDKPQTKL